MSESLSQLEVELSGIPTDCEAKVDMLNRIGSELIGSPHSRALEYLQDAASISQKIDYRRGLAGVHFNKGLYYNEEGHYDKAIEEFNKALGLWQSPEDECKIMATFKCLGNACLYQGDYPEGLDYYAKAIALGEDLNDELGVADLCTNSGVIYHFQGNYLLSLKAHLKALNTYEKLDIKGRMASSYMNIGLIYNEQKNYSEALQTFEKALVIRTEDKDPEALADLYNNIGIVYKNMGTYDESLRHYSMALEIRKKLDNKIGIAYSYNNLGTVYFSLGDIKLAWDYYERSLEIYRELEDKRGMTMSYINLGELFIRNSDYEKAGIYLKDALELANETGAKDALRDALYHLSELGAVQKNFEAAYDYYLQYASVDKEITSADISRQLTQMTLGYKIEQKERETELERVKNIELKKAYDSLDDEKKRSELLLLNILPEQIAVELKAKGSIEPRYYDQATILFADLLNFTKISEILSPHDLISRLDTCFRNFDLIVEKKGVEKIKVIGDAYMCAGGIPIPNKTHATDVIETAMEMLKFMRLFDQEQQSRQLPSFQFRIGIHSGPVIAGVIGLKKFSYDIWGDTVNTASRMESSGEPGKINISAATYELIKDKYHCTYRGKIGAKNKGQVDMYFIE